MRSMTWEPLVLGAILIGVWEAFVRASGIVPILLPAPSAVFGELVDNLPTFGREGIFSLIETLIGFGVGLAVGFLCAILIFTSPYLRRTLYPILFGFRIVPKVAFVPLFLIWFGSGVTMKAMLTAMAIFFIFLVQTLAGLEAVEPELLELARSLRMGRAGILWRLRLPSALPSIMVGVKLGVTYALTMVIVGEMVVSNKGMGAVIVESSRRLRTAETLAAILVVVIGGLILYGIGMMADRRLTSWYAEEPAATRR